MNRMKRALICLLFAVMTAAALAQPAGHQALPGTSPKKPTGKFPAVKDTPEVKAEKAKLAKLAANSKAARNAYEKNAGKPTAGKFKKAAADTIMKEADAVLVSPAMGPKDKYPKALGLYREVVKLDPKNKEAQDAIKTIVSIYKQMGRPVPGGG